MIPFSCNREETISYCVPKLEYQASNDMVFIAFRPKNELWAERGYDPNHLINTEEYYLRIEKKNKHKSPGYTLDKNALEFKILSKGNKLILIGEILMVEPRGLKLIANSFHIDLKAKVGKDVVWFGLGLLTEFDETKIEQNINNNKILKLKDYLIDSVNWKCPR